MFDDFLDNIHFRNLLPAELWRIVKHWYYLLKMEAFQLQIHYQDLNDSICYAYVLTSAERIHPYRCRYMFLLEFNERQLIHYEYNYYSEQTILFRKYDYKNKYIWSLKDDGSYYNYQNRFGLYQNINE